MKRMISILVFSLLCLSLNTWAADQLVNLAGTWILDSKNSDPSFLPMPNIGAPQMGRNNDGGEMDRGGRGGTPASRDMSASTPGGGTGGSIPGFGRGPQSTASNAPMVIEQNESEVRISRTSRVMGKEMPVFERYRLDGADHTQMTQIAGSPDPVKVVTRAKLKKNSLLVLITSYAPQNKSELKKNFSLSKDGKTLTVKSSHTTSMGVLIQDQIYHKQ